LLNSTATVSYKPKQTNSLSSQGTASSGMLERVGGNMHVVQRVQTTSTVNIPTPSESVSSFKQQPPWIVGPVTDVGELVTSPVELSQVHQERPRVMIGPRPKPPVLSHVVPPPMIPVAGMADRPAEYERLTPMNNPVDQASGGPQLPSVLDKGAAEERGVRSPTDVTSTNVKWGLSEKPALFLANPDERK